MVMITVRYTRRAELGFRSPKCPSTLTLNRALSLYSLFPRSRCFVALRFSLRGYIYSLLEPPGSPQRAVKPGTNPRHPKSSHHKQVTSTGLPLNPNAMSAPALRSAGLPVEIRGSGTAHYCCPI